LVPSSGKADTLEGEILRAYNRLAYRFYNDGDIYFMDYGEETCGSSYNFLKKHAQEIPGLKNELAKLRTTNEKKYEAVLENLGDIIIKFLYKKTQSKEELTPNTEDSR